MPETFHVRSSAKPTADTEASSHMREKKPSATQGITQSVNDMIFLKELGVNFTF